MEMVAPEVKLSPQTTLYSGICKNFVMARHETKQNLRCSSDQKTARQMSSQSVCYLVTQAGFSPEKLHRLSHLEVSKVAPLPSLLPVKAFCTGYPHYSRFAPDD